MRRFTAIALLLLMILPSALAQRPTKPPLKPGVKPAIKTAVKKPARRFSIIAMAGVGWPIAKQSLTDFWRYGPNGMLAFSTPVSRRLSLGIGADFTILRFSTKAFAEKFPTLTPPERQVTWMNVFLLARYDFPVYYRFSPYIQASFGPSRLTQASFTGVVDSVKNTYYEIHPRSRLALGLSGGVTTNLTNRLAWVMEVNGVIVYHDTEAGMRIVLRGGFKFTW